MATQPERRKADRRSTAIPRDEHELLLAYRRAKALKHAELNVAIQEGKRVKLWLTEKMK